MEQNNREIAIQLSGVKKMYKLGQIGGGTLQADLQSWWARKRGKEDPNTKIGTDQRLIGKTFMALNGIDLTIYKGEAVGIIGSNGAGKSTMLKLLSRVTAPTEGDIDINGRIASMLEVGTGFHPEMTGRENVYLNGAILGMTKEEIDAKMEQIIDFSEVRDFIDTPVKRYSSGMFVKLAFSVAAHLDSEIMIMDEVLAVGDMAFQKKCLDKMREAAKKQGRTVLYVSHNMNTIRTLCDRCIVLDKGKVVFEGKVESAINRYLGIDETVSSNEINVTDKIRDPYLPNPKVKINKLSFHNKNACFNFGEKLYFSLDIINTTNADANIMVRVILRSISGLSVTMSSTEKPLILKCNSATTINMLLDISNIVPGRYYLDFVLFESGDLGITNKVDCVTNLYVFDIVPSQNLYNGAEWNTEWWGYVCNGNLSIISEGTEDENANYYSN